MKVLGIYGSPRPGGTAILLLDQALEGAAIGGAEVERVYARDLKMSGCLECGGCDETGACVIPDDMDAALSLTSGSRRSSFFPPPCFSTGCRPN